MGVGPHDGRAGVRPRAPLVNAGGAEASSVHGLTSLEP